MPEAKGAIIGFGDVHTRAHIYRAIIEGINYALIEGLEHIEKKSKVKVNTLMVSGGGSQSNAICQITADMFNKPVVRGQTYETSGLGAAINGFMGLKLFSSYQEAVKTWFILPVFLRPGLTMPSSIENYTAGYTAKSIPAWRASIRK